MKKLIYLFAVMALMATFVACEKNETLISAEAKNQKEKSITQDEINVLTFDSEIDFNNMVESIRYNNLVTRSANNNFKSIYDEYEEAMAVADDYYLREGGYEEFKEKYPNLYYPEYKGDYSAYLPVSDEAIAKVLNKKGQVIIAGQLKDMRDIFSYEKLQELQLSIPDIDAPEYNITTTRSSNVTLTESKQRINDKRKVWLTFRGGIKNKEDNLITRVDVCFRKKGILYSTPPLLDYYHFKLR